MTLEWGAGGHGADAGAAAGRAPAAGGAYGNGAGCLTTAGSAKSCFLVEETSM